MCPLRRALVSLPLGLACTRVCNYACKQTLVAHTSLPPLSFSPHHYPPHSKHHVQPAVQWKSYSISEAACGSAQQPLRVPIMAPKKGSLWDSSLSWMGPGRLGVRAEGLGGLPVGVWVAGVAVWSEVCGSSHKSPAGSLSLAGVWWDGYWISAKQKRRQGVGEGGP